MDNESFFREFCEDWTRRYIPMQHTCNSGSNQRFFLCDGFAGMIDMMRSIEPESSPCFQMESNVEGYTTPNYDYRSYSVYICVRATEQSDGMAAAVSKEESKRHATQFMLYLKSQEREFVNRGLHIDFDQINYTTVGPLWDSWNCLKLTIDVGALRNLCLDKALLIDLPNCP